MPVSGTQATSSSPNNSLSIGNQPIPAGTDWNTALLEMLHAPLTGPNYEFLNSWFGHEHSSSDIQNQTMYADNPFFSSAGAGGTVGQFHAGMFPSIPGHPGLAQYPTVATGVLVTATHIHREYPNIEAALRSGNPYGYSGSINGVHAKTLPGELGVWSTGGYSNVGTSGVSSPTGPTLGEAVLPTTGVFGYGGPVGSAVGAGRTAYNTSVSAAKSTADFLSQVTNPFLWLRIAEIVGGGILVAMGLYLIAKDMGINAPKPPSFIGGATDSADDLSSAFEAGQVQGMRAQARRAGRRSIADATYAEEPARSSSIRRERIQRQASEISDSDIPF